MYAPTNISSCVNKFQHDVLKLLSVSLYRETNQFTPIAKKKKGDCLGTIYLAQCLWLGKVNDPSRHLTGKNATSTAELVKQINLGTLLEKVGADFYKIFQTEYDTPVTCLSEQVLIDDFTKKHGMANHWFENGVLSTLRVMSKYMYNYIDLAVAKTRLPLPSCSIDVQTYIKFFHRPPEKIIAPNGTDVPLLGLMELCACMRVIGDPDGLGGGLTNAGFKWEIVDMKYEAARIIKVDPGFAFRFDLFKYCSENKSLKTKERDYYAHRKDIQVATEHDALTFRWTDLKKEQKQQFLSTLKILLTVSKEVLFYGFYREGLFNRGQEVISKDVAQNLVEEMITWIELQKKIYAVDIAELDSEGFCY